MPNRRSYQCYKCGYGSLVKSNFKCNVDHKFKCRAINACNHRQKYKPWQFEYWRLPK